VLCSGKEGGAFVPGALIARGDYAEQNPENVAKFLAVYLRAGPGPMPTSAEAIAMMKKFYEQGGTSISEASMRKEFDTRPTFNLTQQLQNMDRAGASANRRLVRSHGRVHEGHGRDPRRAAGRPTTSPTPS
jgi:ABC-type nitrate/sulfonate/bicarbonate transport system substrate-binding protein